MHMWGKNRVNFFKNKSDPTGPLPNSRGSTLALINYIFLNQSGKKNRVLKISDPTFPRVLCLDPCPRTRINFLNQSGGGCVFKKKWPNILIKKIDISKNWPYILIGKFDKSPVPEFRNQPDILLSKFNKSPKTQNRPNILIGIFDQSPRIPKIGPIFL
jgi:hypothetical protein